MQISFEQKGIEELKIKLGKLEKVLDITDPVIRNHATIFAHYMRNKQYPSELPNQKYVRTGLLGKRFRAKHAGLPRGSHGVENRVNYAAFVVKRGMQNKQYHAWRWWTLEGQAEKSVPQLEKNIAIAIDEALS